MEVGQVASCLNKLRLYPMQTAKKPNPYKAMNNPIAEEILEDVEDFDLSPDEGTTLTLKVDPESCGMRLDKVLSSLLPQYSRNRLQLWIEEGVVTVDGAPAKIRTTLYGDEVIVVQPQAIQSEQPYEAEPMDLDIIYEDETLMVINKPAGLVVHPAAGNWTGTLLNGLLHHAPALSGVPRAGIVHRLDKDTTGLMVVAKTLAAQTNLVRQLQERTVRRSYLALVWGHPVSNGRVEAAIARHPRERVKMAVSQSLQAKEAVTHYQKLTSSKLDDKPVALLRCQLETGRTHQIRVHMQSLGFPLVGDSLYGKQHLVGVFPRQALHAQQLGLRHPTSREECLWSAPLPLDMQTLLQQANIPIPDPVL